MELIKISKYYINNKKEKIEVLEDVTYSFKKNKMYGVLGKSGCGKSTLINILGFVDEATNGTYLFDGKNTSHISEKERAFIRNKRIGFIFQDFYLNERLTALENVLIPLLINNDLTMKQRKAKAQHLLEKLGIGARANHYPSELSGGEQQRVAIARALINDPDILLADEPTGNLDGETEKEIFKLLKKISEQNKCVIIVSHNEHIQDYCDVLLKIEEKKIKEFK